MILKLQKKLDSLLQTTSPQHYGIKLKSPKNKLLLIFLLSKTMKLVKLNNGFKIKENLKEHIFWYLNDIQSKGKCSTCGKDTKINNVILGYEKYCCRKCSLNSEDFREKRKNTNIKKYGVEHYTQTKEFKEKAQETSLKKYGVKFYRQTEEYNKKIKEDSLEKYGVEHYTQTEEFKEKVQNTHIKKYGKHFSKTEKYKEKYKSTSLKKYGTNSPIENINIKSKTRTTNIERYGVDNPMKNRDIKEKQRVKEYKTKIEKYGSLNCFLNKEIRDKHLEKLRKTQIKKYKKVLQELVDLSKLKDSFKNYLIGSLDRTDKWTFTCKKCNTQFEDYLFYNGLPRCPKCFPYSISQAEIDLKNYIVSLGTSESNILTNDRKILDGKELDLYISSHNLAIEYNGLMFHSFGKSNHSMFNNYELEGLNKNNHLNKTNLCEEKKINLLHISENEWLNFTKQDIWKSIISTKLGKNNRIYARNTYVKEIKDSKIKNSFLEENHLQGKDNSSLKLGLYYKDELVSIMTFGKSRYDKKVDWELLRFANKKFTSIVGGASKLFKYFQKNFMKKGESIISYADRRHSLGNLYENLGFTLSHISSTNFYYFKEGNLRDLKSRIEFQKYKLKEKLEEYDEKLTASENMYHNGYRKIYDSGNLVYIFKRAG